MQVCLQKATLFDRMDNLFEYKLLLFGLKKQLFERFKFLFCSNIQTANYFESSKVCFAQTTSLLVYG